MSAYVMVLGTPTDMEKFKAYSAAAGPTIAEFGGEIIGKGKPQFLTGSLDIGLGAVVRFPDEATAHAWYASDAYQALVPLRDEGFDCTFVLVG